MRGVLMGLSMLYVLGGLTNAGVYGVHFWSLGWPPTSVMTSAAMHGATWPADLVQATKAWR